MAVCLLTSSPLCGGQRCMHTGTRVHVSTYIVPVRGVKSVELKQGGQSEKWPVMEGALFIYPHKRAHLYICPYNFIVLSPQHKDGEKYFSCSTCFKQKCACLLIKKAPFKHHCLHCFLFLLFILGPCMSFVSSL